MSFNFRDTLTVLTWNINGWYDNTKFIRTNIITGSDPDIAVICETHLAGEDYVKISDYHCIPHNRKVRHLRAKKNYGGVCIYIKRYLYAMFSCVVVDKEYDGILAVKFNSKDSDYSFIVIALYLPPEQSTWGRDGAGFYAHVLKLIYEHSYCDSILLAGDLNSKMGTAQDYIPEVDDNIQPRDILDKNRNKHGQELVDFLIESKMCVCNGRVTPQYDNYTFIHTRGKSVIDYICVPVDFVNECIEFKVATSRDMMNVYCDINDDNVDLSKMIPDHSVLTLKFKLYHTARDDQHEQSQHISHDEGNTQSDEYDQGHIYFKRYNVQSIPNVFMNNDVSQEKLIQLIEDMELLQQTQQEVDNIYMQFCTMYYEEMNIWLKSKNVHPAAYKRFKRRTKPFWNDDLTLLWNDLCEKEKMYLQCHDNRRRHFRTVFCTAQKVFDTAYSKARRNYQRSTIFDIENVCSSNPKEFWESIKKLGPCKKNDIPMEVYDDDGGILNDQQSVLAKWKQEFEGLYNFVPEPGVFDDTFYNNCTANMNLSGNDVYFDELDNEISLDEVRKVVNHAHNRKSVGIDNLPYEIFKNSDSHVILTLLFNKIYEYSITPSIWNLAIIKPIPKNSLADPRLPLEYRGISLLSTVYKLFTSVLNNRIVKTAEQNNLYADEQNGFRKKRSCEDHLFSLMSVIRNRKRDRLPTFVAFVDFEKAFDRVDRNLLLYKLKCMGIGGKMFNMIKSIYTDCKSCVNVNGFLTPSFSSAFGVRQGDTLSPTLFGLYINDLAKDLNDSKKGIKINDNLMISLLLYADDLAIMADSEDNLQYMLNILESWCKKWRMRVNIKKTKIVHFKTSTQARTGYPFMFNNSAVECIDRYKYLGIVVDEHLDFNTTASILANSANRALGSIYTKFNKLKGLGFNTYTTLYHSGVTPILDYCAGIWGYQKFGYIDTIQNRAIRFYLGLHRFAPNLAINGDVGWVSSGVRRKVEMFRYWNRIMKMDSERLTKKLFMYDFANRRASGSWNSDIFKLFQSVDMINAYYNMNEVDLIHIKNILHNIEKDKWETDIKEVPKLRTYCTFKECYETEPYVYRVCNRAHRSILSQFRCGILPIKIETGRYTNIPLEFRQCILCDQNAIEDENHFLFKCEFYSSIRNSFFNMYKEHFSDFDNVDDVSKLKYMMSHDMVKITAELIYSCYCKRRDFIYK